MVREGENPRRELAVCWRVEVVKGARGERFCSDFSPFGNKVAGTNLPAVAAIEQEADHVPHVNRMRFDHRIRDHSIELVPPFDDHLSCSHQHPNFVGEMFYCLLAFIRSWPTSHQGSVFDGPSLRIF